MREHQKSLPQQNGLIGILIQTVPPIAFTKDLEGLFNYLLIVILFLNENDYHSIII